MISARLAEALGVSPATAFGTVRRMERDGLINVSRKKEIALTVAGNMVAEEVIRRHRLAERFLTDVLDIAWHKAYAEAHRLEHGISQEVADSMVRLLKNPTSCPHGYPIPGSEGYARTRHIRSHLKSLSEIPKGTRRHRQTRSGRGRRAPSVPGRAQRVPFMDHEGAGRGRLQGNDHTGSRPPRDRDKHGYGQQDHRQAQLMDSASTFPMKDSGAAK